MKVYVAGSSRELDRCAAMMERLRAGGHVVTHDWVKIIRDRGEGNPTDASEHERRTWASEDLAGVDACDAFILLMSDPPSPGAWFEAGYAHSKGKPLIVSGPYRDSIFTALARICVFDDDSVPFFINSHDLSFQTVDEWMDGPLLMDDMRFAQALQNVTEFVKHDAGKLRFDLLDPDFEAGIAEVLTLGARKYSPDNWQKCPEPFERYYSALRRHLTAFARGERADAETGLSHLLHAACCLMFLYHFELEGKLFEEDADG